MNRDQLKATVLAYATQGFDTAVEEFRISPASPFYTAKIRKATAVLTGATSLEDEEFDEFVEIPIGQWEAKLLGTMDEPAVETSSEKRIFEDLAEEGLARHADKQGRQ